MADRAITSRASQMGLGYHIFEDYSSGAITAGTVKREWTVPFYCEIRDVICDAETAGLGAGNDVIDVNRNGTTIYTTQANRPTKIATDTGLFSETGEPDVSSLVPGDILSYDVDSVGAGGGSARFKISIIVGIGR